MNLLRHIFLLLCLLLPVSAAGQTQLYENYIQRFGPTAVEQMKKHGVPASITLAQGLLESAAGTSTLARKGNNHFGIKCGGTWRGPYMLRDDDAPNEKFRVYKNAQESYEDHSLFLRNGRRYASLFQLKPTDYKGWAHGLKRAGYATSPTYASALINIIERYDLTRFDGMKSLSRHERNELEKEEKLTRRAGDHPIRKCNGQFYLVAQPGDTYASLAKRMKIREKKLRAYNDVDAKTPLKPGDIVFLGKKARKADKKLKMKHHILQPGESLHTVSQIYGVRLDRICKMNPIGEFYHFKVGDRIRIR